MSKITLTELAGEPDAPAAGRVVLYGAGGQLYSKDSAGDNTQLAGGVPTVLVADINDPSAELASLSGAGLSLLAVIQDTPVASTTYAWESPATKPVDIPRVVEGAGGVWVAVAGEAVAPAFGRDADDSLDLALHTTNDGSNPPVVPFNTFEVMADADGRYRFGGQLQFGMDSTNQTFRTQMFLDNVPASAVFEVEVKDLDDRPFFSAFLYDDLTAGPHIYEMRFSASGGATASIFFSHFEFWRIA